MKKQTYFFIISFTLIAASLVLSFSSMALALILAILGILLMGFNIFERKETSAEKLVLLAILTAVSSAGRMLFASLPSVNPSSFIVIMSAMIFGPSFGFMTGALTALVSNMLLGHGPWTLWQMLLWGLMGFLAGMVRKPLKEHLWIRLAYGFIWGFLFGWGMNLYYVLSGYITETGFKAFLIASSASFIFDMFHAVFNLLLILLLGNHFIKIFERTALKYGLKDISVKKE
ncbi:MAG: ECF transporter S component [Clostridia bacterium]|nr:ECF transporter S component [Clostridia bacterium]